MRENFFSPILGTIVAYAFGILIGNSLLEPKIFIVCGFCIAVYCVIRKYDFKGIVYNTGCCTAGYLSFCVQSGVYAENNLRYSLPNYPVIAQVYGRIKKGDKDLNPQSEKIKWENFNAECLYFKSDLNNRWETTSGSLRIKINEKHLINQEDFENRYFYATGVVRLKKNKHALVPHLSIGSHGSFKILNDSTSKQRPHKKVNDLKSVLYSRLAGIMHADDEVTRLMAGLSLGMKNKNFHQDIAPFRASGTSHLFAISGLHVGIITAVTFQILNLFLSKRGSVSIASIPIIWAYIFFVGAPPSAVRAGIMASIVLLGYAQHRPNHWPNSLHLAALCYLFIFPKALFELGFLYSFSAVFWIIYFSPQLRSISKKINFCDPLLPKKYQPKLSRISESSAKYITGLIFLSLVCWTGTLPITSLAFGEFHVSGIILNIIMVPITSIALLSILLGWTSIWCGEWVSRNFFELGYFLINQMSNLAKLSAQQNWNTVNPHMNNIYYWAIFYLWLWLSLLVWTKHSDKNKIIWVVSGIGLILPQIINLNSNPEMIVRSVSGDGSHVLSIEQKRGKNFFFDVGRQSIQSQIRQFIPFRAHPEVIVLRHASKDQMEAYADWGYLNPLWISLEKKFYRSPAWRDFLKDSIKFNVEFNNLKNNPLGKCWKLIVPDWGEDEEFFSKASDHSILAHWSNGEKGILICPPLTKHAQSKILEMPITGRIDGIICSMDKSNYPLEKWFVNHYSPSWILVGDSKFPVEEQFKDEDFVRWKNELSDIWIRIHSKSGNWTIFPTNAGWRLKNQYESVIIYPKTEEKRRE